MVEIVVTTTGAGTITNTAAVAGNQGDPDEGNNTDTENTTVNAVTPPSAHGSSRYQDHRTQDDHLNKQQAAADQARQGPAPKPQPARRDHSGSGDARHLVSLTVTSLRELPVPHPGAAESRPTEDAEAQENAHRGV